jgi:hypothetical protein
MKLESLPPPTSPQYAVQNDTMDGAGKEAAWTQRVSGTPVKAGFVNYKLQTRKVYGQNSEGNKTSIILKQRVQQESNRVYTASKTSGSTAIR